MLRSCAPRVLHGKRQVFWETSKLLMTENRRWLFLRFCEGLMFWSVLRLLYVKKIAAKQWHSASNFLAIGPCSNYTVSSIRRGHNMNVDSMWTLQPLKDGHQDNINQFVTGFFFDPCSLSQQEKTPLTQTRSIVKGWSIPRRLYYHIKTTPKKNWKIIQPWGIITTLIQPKKDCPLNSRSSFWFNLLRCVVLNGGGMKVFTFENPWKTQALNDEWIQGFFFVGTCLEKEPGHTTDV